MRLDKLSLSAQEAFQASMGVAGDAQASIIEPVHMLKALLDSSENNLNAILRRIGADPAQLAVNVNAAIAAKPKASGASMPMASPGNDLIKVIDTAVKEAENAEKAMPVSTVPGASNSESVSAAEIVGEACCWSGSPLWLENCI